jgi:hypothetical protein
MGLLNLIFKKGLKLRLSILLFFITVFLVKWNFPEYLIPVFIFLLALVLLIVGWMAVKAFSTGSFFLKMISGKPA